MSNNGITLGGRFPCWDCTLKHLGSAAVANLISRANMPTIIEHVRIFVSEAQNGYPDHIWLAVGALNIFENRTSPEISLIVRNFRKQLMESEIKNKNFDFDLFQNSIYTCYQVPEYTLFFDNSNAVMNANLMEAYAECPDNEVAIEIDKYLNNPTAVPNIMEWIFRISSQRKIFETLQG